MTAITFPLKKFPGQFSHRSMVFTGRVSAHIIVLTVSTLLHGLLVNSLHVRLLLDASLYSLPIFGAMIFHMVYLVKVNHDDADYFEMSLKTLKERYEQDSRYFDFVGVLGYLLSAASLSFASVNYLQEGLIIPLLIASNACLLLLIYQVSLHMGLYTNKRIAVYVLSFAVVETAFIAASLSGIYVASFTILFTIAAYFLYERTKRRGLYRLLQNIIK